MFVHLVGDDEQVGLDGKGGQRAEFGVTGDHAGGIVRRVDDQRPGLGADRRPQALDVDGEAVPVLPHGHGTPVASGHGDHRGVRVVERLDEQHLGAGFHQAEHRCRNRLGGADRDEDLGVRVVLRPVAPAALFGDGLAQFGDAQAGRVLVHTVGDSLLRRGEHGRRTVFVGEALAEIHRSYPSRQCRHLGENGHRVGLQAFDRHGWSVSPCQVAEPRRRIAA